MKSEPLMSTTSKIQQKWGFGMAPIKPDVQANRLKDVKKVLLIFENADTVDLTDLIASLSEVKGLFNRILRQDQWDWFNVFEQLGRPGRITSRKIVEEILSLRNAIKENDDKQIILSAKKLSSGKFLSLLNCFVDLRDDFDEGDFIYILSTREMPNMLKIGYTSRSVRERVKEINSATGVIIPFGVRAVWKVQRDKGFELERIIHEELSTSRVRKDREFFEMDYRLAMKKINQIITQSRLESI